MEDIKTQFVSKTQDLFGKFKRIGDGQSLFSFQDDTFRLYVRYSKVHSGKNCFYGLREKDLRVLEGHIAFICLLWDSQEAPLILPYDEFEEVFRLGQPADDGQYKVQTYIKPIGTDFYISRVGRYGVDAYFGYDVIYGRVKGRQHLSIPSLTHCQIQTLLGEIGRRKNYDVWIPLADRTSLDWSLCQPYTLLRELPSSFRAVHAYLGQIDVVWLEKGARCLSALYEVEHSTPIYSGLLRFNDVLLAGGAKIDRFAIVSNEQRRAAFAQQVNRPTFNRSGLSEACTFLEYDDVYRWAHRYLTSKERFI